MKKKLHATASNSTNLQAIEDFLDGIHPHPEKFEAAMQQDKNLNDEVELQRQLAEAFADPNKNKLRAMLSDISAEAMLDNQLADAFSDPKKNELREVLDELNQEFAMEVSHRSLFVTHLQQWSKQYIAAAAVLAVALVGLFLIDGKSPDVPQVAQNQPTTQPAEPTRSPESVETPALQKPQQTSPDVPQLAQNQTTVQPSDPTRSPESVEQNPQEEIVGAPQRQRPAPKSNENLAQNNPNVKVENVFSEITRGSDGAAKIELVADLILKNGYEDLEEVQVRLIPHTKNEPTISEQVALRTENAIGYVKNSPPSKVLEVEISMPLEAGEYDVQVILPDGEVIFNGRTLVKNAF